MNRRRAAWLTLWLSFGAPVVLAQTDAGETLHEAWLHEAMDLDVARAVAGYRRVAADASPGHLGRWIATARLIELHRLGAGPAELPTIADAPQPLRTTFQQAADVLPVHELLARTRGDAKTTLQVIGSDAGRLPALRSVVPTAEDWLMSQIGPSLRDRWRQRMASFSNRSRGSAGNNVTERVYAADILRAELQGRTTQADALRTLYFADWRPPTTSGEATILIARMRTQMATMLADEGLSTTQTAMLRELAEAIEQRAAIDPAAAVAFVLRLPIYAERLLPSEPDGR